MDRTPRDGTEMGRRIAVIGGGYVGLVTAASLARRHTVTCFEKSRRRLRQLQAGACPIYEPGLPELLREGAESGRLSFAGPVAVAGHEFVFICVGTPSNQGGAAKLEAVFEAASAIGEGIDPGTVVVVKSTVPVGTCEQVQRIIGDKAGAVPFEVVANPEFLREGSAIYDADHPDRVVIGSASPSVTARVASLYRHLDAAIFNCDMRTAELIKYTANAFLATKISFINEIANIAEGVGVDVTEVAAGIGMDRRIGREFMRAGIGYGGSCFPKDVQALRHMASSNAYRFRLLEAVTAVNRHQRSRFVEKMDRALGGLKGTALALYGLTFKPNTNDMRKSVSVDLIRQLVCAGAWVRACDPVALAEAARILAQPGVTFCKDPYEAAEDADALVLVTEWDEYLRLDYSRIRKLVRRPMVFDGRNALDRQMLEGLGFAYCGVGR